MKGNIRRYLAFILVFAMIFTAGCTGGNKPKNSSEPAKTDGTSVTDGSSQGSSSQEGTDKTGEAGQSSSTETGRISGETDTAGNGGTSDPAGTGGSEGNSDTTGNNGMAGTAGNSGPAGESDNADNTGTNETTGSGDTADDQGTSSSGEDDSFDEAKICERFLGTWYLDHGEIEGYDWSAEDVENITRITFYENLTAQRVSEYLDADPFIEEGQCKFGYDEDLEDYYADVDFGIEDATFSYSINANGELEQYGYLIYDGDYPVLSFSVYTREPFWGEGNYFDRYAKTVPLRILELIDNAPQNAGLVAIADPDAELSQACTDGRWELIDESGNKWVNCPWNNPKELIIANCSARRVSLEVHEPNSEYDPKSSEDGWEAGPFMYYADLKPGELCRFIVDMPENKIDATMCLYIEFEDLETKYYLRIFRYDNEDPYIVFPGL